VSKSLAAIEKSYIIEVLNECDWRIGGKSGAAKILDLPDSILRSHMTKLNIQRN
jgi:formate hydrogenlyase transcriptional activator